MSSSNPSRSTFQIFSAAVSSAAIALSGYAVIAANGDVALVRNTSSPAGITLGSGSVLTPTVQPFTQSGSSNFGFVARIQTPQNFSSGALLRDFSVECGAKTTAQFLTVGINKDTNQGASGSQVLRRKIVAAANNATRAGTGSWKVNDGNYLVALSETGASANSTGDCVLKANWSELYTSAH